MLHCLVRTTLTNQKTHAQSLYIHIKQQCTGGAAIDSQLHRALHSPIRARGQVCRWQHHCLGHVETQVDIITERCAHRMWCQVPHLALLPGCRQGLTGV